MAVIKSGEGSDNQLIIDSPSSAMRVAYYGRDGIVDPPLTFTAGNPVGAGFTPPATPTDMFAIAGAPGAIIYVTRVCISSIQTTAGINAFFLIKRSRADQAGTFTNPTPVHAGANNLVQANATIYQYSANPTSLGTSLGNIWSGLVQSPASATAICGVGGVQIDFLIGYGCPVVLRGPNEWLAVNFAGAALPAGMAVSCFIQWHEYPLRFHPTLYL